MEQDADISLNVLKVDGGAAASDMLMQMQADLLNVAVERPAMLETTAFGAAAAAGMGAGVYDSIASISGHCAMERRFDPSHNLDQAKGVLARWRRAVHRSRSLEED
jgi:glycerol kinase